MNCTVSGEGERPENFDRTEKISRKEHVCCECGEVIPVKSAYVLIKGKWDGEFETYKMCVICDEISTVLTDGVTYGYLWDEIREQLLPDLGFACIQSLSIPAKEKIISAWREWKLFPVEVGGITLEAPDTQLNEA